MKYRIEIDRSLCSGFGACAELAPDVFELAARRHRRDSLGREQRPRRARGRRLVPDGRDLRRRSPGGGGIGVGGGDRRCRTGRRALRRAAQGRRLRGSDPDDRGGARRSVPPARALKGAPRRRCRPRRYPSPEPGLVDGVGDRADARTPSRADRPGAPERDAPRRFGNQMERAGGRHRLARATSAVPPRRARRPHPAVVSGRPCPQKRSQTRPAPGRRRCRLPRDRGRLHGECARRGRHARRSLATPLTSARRRDRAVAREALPRPRDRPSGRSHPRPDRRCRGEGPRRAPQRWNVGGE